jgi:hypothetical protein
MGNPSPVPPNKSCANPSLKRLTNTLRSIVRRVDPVAKKSMPWSHIQAYAHRQEIVDACFYSSGFSVLSSSTLDLYEGSEVRATVYSRISS